MRINQFVARASGISRRAADKAIFEGQVVVNNKQPSIGQQIGSTDTVRFNGQIIELPNQSTIILINKPVGYVCSRNGQGSPTIYNLLPNKYHTLKLVGRLDKDSSGLLLLTDDGERAHTLMHPRFEKMKVYIVQLDKVLQPRDQKAITQGIKIDSYVSRLQIHPLDDDTYQVLMHEGHNRQIRRTFAAIGYTVSSLHRTQFGPYTLGSLTSGSYKTISQ